MIRKELLNDFAASEQGNFFENNKNNQQIKRLDSIAGRRPTNPRPRDFLAA